MLPALVVVPVTIVIYSLRDTDLVNLEMLFIFFGFASLGAILL